MIGFVLILVVSAYGCGAELNRRPLRPELSAQAIKSPALGHSRTSGALRRLRLRRLTASDRS
jgi:hypothetical protein